MRTYYHIIDLNIIAKEEDYISYLYDAQKRKWVVDKDKLLMDRVIGYDGDSIGSSDMLGRVKEISEEETLNFIAQIE